MIKNLVYLDLCLQVNLIKIGEECGKSSQHGKGSIGCVFSGDAIFLY